MKDKDLLLTFDYELFLGENSGSVLRCMIEPTEKIIPLLKKHLLKAIFFVDTTYVMQLEKQALKYPKAADDLNQIKCQLTALAADGHYLFHHLHPHWMDAIYHPETNTWDCSNHSRFSLSNLTDQLIEELFSFSDCFLRNLYPIASIPEYLGFRAGGLYSQPIHRILPFFKKFNIRYDFSVLKGALSKGVNYSFDYTSASIIKPPIYNFKDDNSIEDAYGSFTEIALENFKMSTIQRLFNSVYYRLYSKKDTWQRIGDGSSSGNRIKHSRTVSSSSETYSIELMNIVKSYYYVSCYKQMNLLHIISHPKLMSPQSIHSFEYFLNLIHEKYNVISDFKTMICANNENK